MNILSCWTDKAFINMIYINALSINFKRKESYDIWHFKYHKNKICFGKKY